MKILFAATEAVPFCKTGGLGDVCGALPAELAALGHDVALVIPGFRRALESGQPIEPTNEHFSIEIGGRDVAGRFLKSYLPESNVPVYLVEQQHYYNRPELYRQGGADYADNCERFIFFSRAVLEAIDRFAADTQVVHCHDWQTGLLPVYLKELDGSAASLDNVASVYTIHNLAYQGSFWHLDMPLTGLDWSYFNWEQLEFHGQLNFMKSALRFADVLTTVSPTYAKEIQTPEHGCGLDGVLRHRAADLYGILNGCDYREWNPETDRRLAANYTADTYREGKPLCKAALQREMNLPQASGTPLLAVVGRLADQKGFDLLAQVIPRTAERGGVQWAILGTGEPHYHELLSELAAGIPNASQCDSNSRTTWPTRSRPGPTCFSCRVATSRVGSTRCTACDTERCPSSVALAVWPIRLPTPGPTPSPPAPPMDSALPITLSKPWPARSIARSRPTIKKKFGRNS